MCRMQLGQYWPSCTIEVAESKYLHILRDIDNLLYFIARINYLYDIAIVFSLEIVESDNER